MTEGVKLTEVPVWRPMHTAPRDGSWFEARCTVGGREVVRTVHFADSYDRLPIGDTLGQPWPTLPTHWRAALNPESKP